MILTNTRGNATEKDMWSRRPSWELRNMVKALSLMPYLNTPEQWARKAVAEEILRERRKIVQIKKA